VELPPEITLVQSGRTASDLHLTWYSELASTDYEIWQSADPYFLPGDSGATLLAQIEPDEEGGILSYVTSSSSTNPFYIVKAIQGSANMASKAVGVFQYSLLSETPPSEVNNTNRNGGEFVDWRRR